MRKDVRLGLAIGGSAIVVVACSVLFFRSPEPQPNPQAGQNPAPTPGVTEVGPGQGLGLGGMPAQTPTGAGASSYAENTGAGSGSINIGPADPRGVENIGVQPPNSPNAWNNAGTRDDDAVGQGLGAGVNWEELLERGEVLARTGTPNASGVGSFNIGTPPGNPGATRRDTETAPFGFGGPSTPSTPTLPPSTGPRSYIVQPGDTYWTISQKEYGNGAYFSHLVRANPGVPANRLKAGVKITIPDRNEVVPSTAQRPAVAAGALDPRSQYRVQHGDNLHVISKKLYGSTDKVAKIYQLNRELIGPNPGALKVNMVLQLPDPPAGADNGISFGAIQ